MNLEQMRAIPKFVLFTTCSLLFAANALAHTNGPRPVNAPKSATSLPSCATSNGREFVNDLIMNGLKTPDFFAPEILITDYALPKSKNNKTAILKKTKTSKVKRGKYALPIIIWDNQWAGKGHTSKKPQFLYLEINQSSTNRISIEFQNIDKPIIEGEMIENEKYAINYKKPYSNLLFEPYKDCWRLIEQSNYK